METASFHVIADLCGLLSVPENLLLIDCLKNGPATAEELAGKTRLPLSEVTERLTLLRKNGLAAKGEAGEPVSLSPFGMYGARKLLQEFLATTHEDGQCGCDH